MCGLSKSFYETDIIISREYLGMYFNIGNAKYNVVYIEELQCAITRLSDRSLSNIDHGTFNEFGLNSRAHSQILIMELSLNLD